MRKILALLVLFTLLSACAGNESFHPIQKAVQENDEISAEENPEWMDADIEHPAEEVVFQIGEENISLALMDIPIIHAYLQGQKNPNQAISNMELEKLETGQQPLFILHFSCYAGHCSHLLIDKNQLESAFLVADLARYETSSLSPDKTKVALQFTRLGETVPLSNIVVFDVNRWMPLSLMNEEKENKLGFKWPIITMEWQDDESLAISYPDLIEPSKESWEAWSATEENSKITAIHYIQ